MRLEIDPVFVISVRLISIFGLIISGVSVNQFSLGFFTLTLSKIYSKILQILMFNQYQIWYNHRLPYYNKSINVWLESLG